MIELYAEDVNYWKTSTKSPDTWMEKTKELIEGIGGIVLMEGFGQEEYSGYSAYMLGFELGGQKFKIIWPVLSSKKQETIAARRQATTFIYHDVKARVMSAKVLGTRAAFFSYLQLPDGRTASQATVDELVQGIPYMLKEIS